MGSELKTTPSAVKTWDRVASELRAYRESQQQAWGDVDSATLGRYLAGEADDAESREIEQALAAYPELGRLTNVVQDVLGELDAEPVAPPETHTAPAVLSLADHRSRKQLARPRSRVQRWASRSALLAAACVLLALGLGFSGVGRGFFPERWAPERPAPPAYASLDRGAERIEGMRVRSAPDGKAPAPPRGLPVAAAGRSVPVVADLGPLEDLDAQVVARQRAGDLEDAVALAEEYPAAASKAGAEFHPRYAVSLNNLGEMYVAQGDLTRAEETFQRAHVICRDTLGPQHPRTVRTRHNLAGVYSVALNTVAADQNDKRGPLTLWAPDGPSRGGFRAGGAPPPPEGVRTALKPGSRAGRTEQTAWNLYYRIGNQKADGVQASVLPVLEKALQETKTAKEKAQLARAIGQLGPAARAAVPTLTACLKDARDEDERRALLYALTQVGPDARAAVPVVLEALRCEDCPEARQLAAQVLVQVAPEVRDEVLDLARAKGKDTRHLRETLRLLEKRQGWVGVHDPYQNFSVRALRASQQEINHLARNYDVRVRVETVPVGRLDPKADTPPAEERPARGVYVRIAHDGSDVRVEVCKSLQEQGLSPERIRTALRDGLKTRDFDAGLRRGLKVVEDKTGKAK